MHKHQTAQSGIPVNAGGKYNENQVFFALSRNAHTLTFDENEVSVFFASADGDTDVGSREVVTIDWHEDKAVNGQDGVNSRFGGNKSA